MAAACQHQLASLFDKLKLSTASRNAKATNLTADDVDMMSVDELASMLGVTAAEAKRIKQERALELSKDQALSEFESDSENLQPNTPSVASEPVPDWNVQGPVPASHSVTKAPAPLVHAPGAVHVDNGTLQRYVQALAIIKRAQASGLEVELPQEEVKFQGLEDIARCKQTEYDDLVKSLSYASSKLKTAGSGGLMARVIHGTLSGPSQQQKDDLKAAAQLQFDECTKKVAACEAVLGEAKAAAAQQSQVVEQLRAQMAELTAAKQFEADLAHTLFSGTAGDAKENQLEAEVAAIHPKVVESQQTIVNFTGVQEKINSALKKLEQAEDKWDNAKSLSRKNWLWTKVTGSKGNVALDLGRTSQSQAALALAQSGLLDLIEAKQAIPDLPKLDVQKLQDLKMEHLKNCFVDVTLPGKQHEADLRSNIKHAHTVEKHAQQALKWVEQWHAKRLIPAHQALEAEYKIKKDALDEYRRSLLEDVLKQRGLL